MTPYEAELWEIIEERDDEENAKKTNRSKRTKD